MADVQKQLQVLTEEYQKLQGGELVHSSLQIWLNWPRTAIYRRGTAEARGTRTREPGCAKGVHVHESRRPIVASNFELGVQETH